jgi:hypothetical protein
MKKIKRYNSFLESHQTEESVFGYTYAEMICKKFGIKNWSINSDGLVDVDGSVNLYNKGLTKLPLKFGIVYGDFLCFGGNLASLEGSPKWVSGGFYCHSNQLTTLEGSPESVGDTFYCHENQLTTLEGGPKSVGGGFDCSYNQLTSLVGGPEVVSGKYYAHNNKINSFEGFPEDYYEGFIRFSNNPVQKILDQFTKELWVKAIHLINDYDAIWNGEVVPERLEMVKEKLGVI